MDAILVSHPVAAPTSGAETSVEPRLQVRWARHLDEVRAAQRLRHSVFVEDLGAAPTPLPGTPPGLDADAFDEHCEHLLVCASATDDAPEAVVGTYRVLLPSAAQRMGRYYSETEFDIACLAPWTSGLAELGRSCIAPAWRQGGVIMMLWSQLLPFLEANGVRHAMGCASVAMPDGGRNAALLWQELRSRHLTDEALRAHPRLPLPLTPWPTEGDCDWPPLVKGYIRCGAKVMGAPAWDPAFGTADLPMLLDLHDIPPSYRKRFMAR